MSPPISRAIAIVVEGVSPRQINAIQAEVAQHANGFWHHIPKFWLVGSEESTTWWRDLLIPHTEPEPPLYLPPTLLVFEMPAPTANRDWGYYGPNGSDQIAWLEENYLN